ncbi:DUF58 domain-containing protein [Candidatus Woesearchaeota archaeon]|nr:DUF58 domain-containing protein [Candidatus Woesearchaeota archaeon]
MAIETDFLNQLNKFSLIVRKRVTSTLSGPKKSTRLGKGLAFADHRIYSPGDDIRNIDWKVYARTDDLYIKNYEEEKNLTVHVLIDSSDSMNFGDKVKKFDYAAMLGIGFAYLAARENEKVQYATFSEKIEILPAQRGVSQVMNMVYMLNNTKPKGPSNIKDSVFQYKKLIGSRALIVLISDFLFKTEDAIETLNYLGDHEIKVIHVLDPLEKELKFEGDYTLRDSETKDNLRVYISQRLRQGYIQKLDEHSRKLQEACIKLGISYHQVTTDTPLFDAFYTILAE